MLNAATFSRVYKFCYDENRSTITFYPNGKVSMYSESMGTYEEHSYQVKGTNIYIYDGDGEVLYQGSCNMRNNVPYSVNFSYGSMGGNVYATRCD